MMKNKFKMVVGEVRVVTGETRSRHSWVLDNGLGVLKSHEDYSWRWVQKNVFLVKEDTECNRSRSSKPPVVES